MTTLPEATVPGEGLHTWASQVRQYPKLGTPGLTFEEHEVAVAQVTYKPTGMVVAEVLTVVDCVLYRNRKGHLIGILNHYRDDCYEFDGSLLEKAGNVNVWVRPDRRRRGVGTKLVAAALRRWPEIDFTQQHYTEAGRALATNILERQ